MNLNPIPHSSGNEPTESHRYDPQTDAREPRTPHFQRAGQSVGESGIAVPFPRFGDRGYLWIER
jgi:hypothetical protein